MENEREGLEMTMEMFEHVMFEDEAKKKRDADKRWAIVSIASIPLVMTLGNSMLIPVLPAIERELGISSFQSSLIITVYSIVAIFFIPLAGYFSDRWGRKKIIIPSLLLAAVGGAIAAFANWKIEFGYPLILFGRVLQGIGAAGAFPIVLPLVGDLFRSDKEISASLGIIETSNTLGKVLSPIIGSYLAVFLWILPFVAIPVFCIISILMVAFLVHSPKRRESPSFREFLIDTKKTLKFNNRWLTSVFLIGGIFMFILFGVLFYLSSRLETEYGIGDLKKGMILAVPLGALCLASYLTGKGIKENQIFMKRLILFGTVLLSASVFALNFTDRLWMSVGLFALVGTGIGIGLPCLDSLITQGIKKENRGTITSLYSSMRFIGVALGPPILAILMKLAHHFIFFLLAALSVLSGIICLLWIRPVKGKN